MVLTPPAPPALPEETRGVAAPDAAAYLRGAAPEVLATARAQRWDPAETLRATRGGGRRPRRGHPTPTPPPRGPARGEDLLVLARRRQLRPHRHPTGPRHSGMDRAGREPRRDRAIRNRKSHLVEALAHAAIDAGRRVAWFTLESLTAAVGRAGADGSVARTITKITRADLIVVDDIGMLPAGQAAAEALYRVIDAAYKRRSVAVTSNLHPSKAHMFDRTRARCCRNITGSAAGRD
jgi:hypothetical protein